MTNDGFSSETDPTIRKGSGLPGSGLSGSGVPTPAGEAPSGEPEAPSRWRKGGRVLWREWIKPLLIIGFVMFSFRSAVADWNDVPTGSMKPTILEGDRIFINKLAYDLKFPFTRWRLAQWKDPAWGDVVVLLSPEDGKRLVKRVVGLPGDVLEIRSDNRLYRNGKPAVYSMLEPPDDPDLGAGPSVMMYSEHVEGREHPILMVFGSRLHPDQVPIGCLDDDRRATSRLRRGSWVCVLGEREYFVMGDNRHNSRDSRYFGPVDRSAILGKATAVALSLDRNNYYKPRWDRFFSELP